jgi:predicted helicase
MLLNKLLQKINSWSDFKNILETKTKQDKGQSFEELTKYFLQYNPIYKTKLKQVWLQKEVPSGVVKKLNLPSNDQGIDLIAETFEGTYWAIQCKYLQDENQKLSHRTISTFVSLSAGIAKNITHCLVCTTVDDYANIYKGKTNISFVNSDEWRKLDKAFFDWLRKKLKGKDTNYVPYKPKPHQIKALKEAKEYFIKENNSRGKLVFPCGAGKSLTGYWITRELKPKSIIVAVPSLSLIKQTLEVYLRETVANNEKVSWLCVCSDEGIGTNDDIAIHANEIGVPCVTDKNFIANWIKDNSKNKTIIFTTYQSGKTISDACKIANHEFDIGIMDEAHKTVGDKDKLFSHLLFDKNIKIKKRIFMTATERRYAGSSDVVLSMDDENVYGNTFTQMSFKEAIEIGILSDYKIITLFISNDEVKNLIQKNAFVKPTGKEWDKETEARTLASLIALRKAMTEYPIHHAVTFHSSIKKAEAFEQSQSVFSAIYSQFTNVQSYHVSGSMPTSRRGKIIDEFANTNKGIITNAKCLTEGVDVPNIDCVLFADPRKSTVDIVQAVGRALRKKEGKDFGYVILPVFTKSTHSEEIIESDEFKEVLTTIRALASNDERIIEYFKDVSKGVRKNKKDSLVQFNIDVQLSEKINEKELIDSIQLKTWDKLAKLSWMPFEEAREFVRELGFKKGKQYFDYCKSRNKPYDIPRNPAREYKNSGWISMNDWLGVYISKYNRRVKINYQEAQNYSHSLKLKSANEWREFVRNGKLPIEYPTAPHLHFKNNGWISWSHFLGCNIKMFGQELEFSKARKLAKSFKLKSNKEWRDYCKNEFFPNNLPTNPDKTYKNRGWNNWADWLGTKTIATNLRRYKSFEEAKSWAIKNKIASSADWFNKYKKGHIPKHFPKVVYHTYKFKWKGWKDFLGKE